MERERNGDLGWSEETWVHPFDDEAQQLTCEDDELAEGMATCGWCLGAWPSTELKQRIGTLPGGETELRPTCSRCRDALDATGGGR
jgi:hypothetical protein